MEKTNMLKKKWSKRKILVTVVLSLSLLLNVAGGYFVFLFIGSAMSMIPRRASLLENLSGLTGPDVLMLGDSLTHEAIWAELFPEYRILNRGISGDTTGDILARLPQVYKLKPKVVFFMAGINDIIQRVDDDTTRANYKKIFDGLRTNLPDTKIYIQSVLPFGATFPFPADGERVHTLNGILKSEARTRRHTFINLWSVLATEQGELRRDFTNDGLHLMGAAYIAWSNQLRPFVREAVGR